MRDIELLAPAGSEESLTAAVRCGADAVYLGLAMFNARQNAKNFDDDGLARAVLYARQRGVKAYLTLNTLLFDDELPLLHKALGAAARAGVDAILAQDLAVAAIVRACAPSIPLHASTQMSIHNASGANALKALGFSRVVLAREMTCGEIANLSRECEIETECFVHGALCMSISGQCYLSSVIGGRSGNRGLCAQPCRLPFRGKGDRGGKGGRGGEYYPLSLKDASLVTRLGELREAGVTSLKIEGRMKRPEYVAAAVTACRRALDGEQPDLRSLEAVFSRSGFTDGYFTGKRDWTMFGIRQREDVVAAAPVLGALAKLYKDETPQVNVDFHLVMRQGEAVSLVASDGTGRAAPVVGNIPQAAITAPTTLEKAQAALSRTGGTFYRARNITAELEDGLMLPASGLNELRRRALEELTRLRGEVKPHEFGGHAGLWKFPTHETRQKPLFRVRLHTVQQLTQEITDGADEIVLPLGQFERLKEKPDKDLLCKLMVELPSIAFDGADKLDAALRKVTSMGVRRAVAGNLGAVESARRHGCQIHGDVGLNITNSLALDEYRKLGLCDATLSFELDLRRIGSLGGGMRRGLIAYGYLPLMRMRNCPIRANGGLEPIHSAGIKVKNTHPIKCANCVQRHAGTLTDRKGNKFFVDCSDGIPTLYNCVPLFMADRLDDIRIVDFITLYFTREEPWECGDILSLYREGKGIVSSITRGLYYRKVL